MTPAPFVRSGRPAGVRVSRDRWLIAYADMITLLLACFAALYAGALGRQDGIVLAAAPGSAPPPPMAAAPAVPPAVAGDTPADMADLRASIAAIAIGAGGDATFELSTDERGVVVTLPEAGVFASGAADPSAAARAILMDLSRVLVRVPNPIRIEGHTDDAPMQSAAFPSNWELSAARATRVVQFLIERGGLPPERLSAAGYGPYHPRVANASPEARALNRRVDIVVLRRGPATPEPSAAGVGQ